MLLKCIKISFTISCFLVILNNSAQPARASTASPINILSFGAKGDCVTDDSAVINSAIASLVNGTAHSGEVYFPKPPGGCYLVNSPIVILTYSGWPWAMTNITLAGDGKGISVVRAGTAMTGLDAVLVKDNEWNFSDLVKDMTFDANGFANHAIHILCGQKASITRVEGLNGTIDDLDIDQAPPCGAGGGVFVTESFFSNNPVIYQNNPKYAPLYNVAVNSSDNELTNNVMINARVANIYDKSAGNHYISNHGYSSTLALAPQYNFVGNQLNVWVGNHGENATDAGMVVTANSTVTSNAFDAEQNHALCFLPDAGAAVVLNNTFSFTSPTAWENTSNAVVQAADNTVYANGSFDCGTNAVPTSRWANASDWNYNNLVLSNSQGGNENLWGTIYTSTVNNTPLVGIGTSSPQSQIDINGEMRVGNSQMSCSTQNAGAIRYDSTNNNLVVCNGSAWKAVAWGKG